MENYRKLFYTKLAELELHQQAKEKLTDQLTLLKKESKQIEKTREIFQKAAILTQNHLANHLTTIVTKALRTVFYEKDVYFKIEFVERRNSIETDMWIEENGYQYSLLESRGFGMADIVSFALKVAYILLHPSDNILIVDEPYRNLGRDKHEIVSQMVKELSSELGIQFIICTYSDDVIAHADKAFFVKQNKKGISIVTETT